MLIVLKSLDWPFIIKWTAIAFLVIAAQPALLVLGIQIALAIR